MSSPDRAASTEPAEAPAGEWPRNSASAGVLELLLPLWWRKWRLLLSALLFAALAGGLALLQPLRFTSQASVVVQPALRPSITSAASLVPGLAGLAGGGGNPIDLYVTILRSQTVADRVITRFELQKVWGTRSRTETLLRLSRSVSFGAGRRDGLVQVTVEDANPHRAAAMANLYVEELRSVLRGFTLDEARQRREFYDAQLLRARAGLEVAQRQLQTSGYDRAALRAEPRAAAEAFGRLQAEATAAEVQLSATRRVRTEDSPEIQQQLAELAGLRVQLSRIELPQSEGPGAFVGRLREFRYAEALAESIARQADAARLDEASDALPMRLLDRAIAPEWPSSPRLPLWVVAGALVGLLLQAAWVLLRHRAALARLDPEHLQRLALLRSLMPTRKPGMRWPWGKPKP